MTAPVFDDDFRLDEMIEKLWFQTLVLQSAIERLVVSVLPWASWFDVKRLCADLGQPFPDGFGPELSAITHQEEILP